MISAAADLTKCGGNIDAAAEWGHTEAFKEYEAKNNNRSKEAEMDTANGLMQIFIEFRKIRELAPSEASVQLLVKSLQDYISANYYTCAECSHTGC